MDYLLHHLLFSTLERDPDKIAVMDGMTRLSFQQLSLRSGYLADVLKERGMRKGDRVVIHLDHDVEQAVAIYAISSVGAIFVPVSVLLLPKQVIHIIKDSECRFLITNKNKKALIESHLDQCLQLEEILLTDDMQGEIPLLRSSLVIEDNLAALLYTSGSTGQSKGVMISHKNLLSGCHIVSEYLDLRESDRLLGVLQLSFDYGLNQLITMIAKGGTYRFLKYTFPNDIVRALKDDEITGLAGIPPIWASLVRSSLAKTPLPHLRYITNSGGAVPSSLLNFLLNALPTTKIVLMYGLTEAFRSTYLTPEELVNHPDSMGKAIPNTEISVVSEDGRLCDPGEIGELVHRGPTVSKGYWRNDEETEKRFRDIIVEKESGLTERVVFSGDLVKMDKDGFLFFVGRKDQLIKCSGVRVSPTEIEEVIYQSGLVIETAAIGIPDNITGTGDKVVLFVVPGKEHKYTEKEFTARLLKHCSEHLPSYMTPKDIKLVDVLPKNSTGKINYSLLKKNILSET